jgi:type IV secretory pathway TrbF-like protein
MEAIANKKWTPQGEAETRYRRARQEWDDRMGNAVIQARNWRLAAFGALGFDLLSCAGMIYLGAQPKAVPHIVHIDKLGAPTYIGPVGQAARDYRPSDASVKYHLRRFVEETRGVSSDPAVVKRNWTDAYAIITPSAANQLSAFAERNDPLKRSRAGRVTVDVVSLVQLSKDSWQADWEEKVWDAAGTQVSSEIWRGTFKVLLRTPESEEQIATNPIGLFIDEFHWSKVGA